jgi:hypothetical protein
MAVCSHYSPELLLNTWAGDASREDSHPYCLRHLAPAQVFLPLQPSQIGGGHRQGAMVQEPGYVLNALSRIPTQLSRSVPQDVKPGRREAGLPKVATELAIEGAAGKTTTLRGRWKGPQRLTRRP